MTTQITINGQEYDLADKIPLPIGEMSLSQLTELHHSICDIAFAAGVEPSRCKTVTHFPNDETAARAIAALHSSVRATVQSQKAPEKKGLPVKKPKVPKVAKPVKEVKPAKVVKGPKLVKMDSNSTGESIPQKRGRKPGTTQPRVIHMGTVLLRPTTKRFAVYRDGMTVAEYLDVAQKNGRTLALATGDINYDSKKGVITIEKA